MFACALSGAVKSAHIEYPLVEMVIADVCIDRKDISMTHQKSEVVGSVVIEELTAWDGEIEVSYRDGCRNIRRFMELHQQSSIILEPSLETNISFSTGRPTGTYVITGGLGGLGLVTARTLVDMGIVNIVLVSRSGRVAYEGQGLENELAWLQTESGANVHIISCDVSDEVSVVRMLSEARKQGGGRVEGVIHAAGVLRDGLIVNGSASAGCNDVWMSKAYSAWLLHKHTVTDSPRVFMTFSSVAAAMGNIGQSSYSAANTYLDALINYRVSRNLAGISLQWPAVSNVGMAAATILHGT
jgi:NADP-dependent 3-hydroxy acid dehydrogenase YdfG